jgi:SNF2 family DNA or RNA helicase
VARMIHDLSQVEFGVVVADEAQHIKNADTQNAVAMRMLKCRNRLLLTGTPLENRMEDVVSLFRFLLPGYLRTPARNVSGEVRRQWLSQVPARVAPYILRRTRGQVLTELPERTDQTLFADMTERQSTLYRKLEQQASDEWQTWEKQGGSAGRMKVLAMLTRLRQASVEPRTLHPEWSRDDSAKAGLFTEILEEAIDSNSRLLVFSQFVSVLEIWRKDMAESGIPSCFIHGGTENRMKEIDRFQQDHSIPVFFLSLKAGGTGFNLTAADKVVLLDPWWNPAIEEQAISRAYRMGQTKAFHSMRLIATGTVEERVISMQQEKRILLDTLWESSEQEQESGAWTERIRDLFAPS